MPTLTAAELVFAITLVATYGAAMLARWHSREDRHSGLAAMKLNRWMVGLSAGTTANSGFIVTGAVGLGYAYGLHWVLLPLSWLLGDIVFWYLFPSRINQQGRVSRATTLSEFLSFNLSGWAASAIAMLCALLVLTCLTGYTAAQWLAGQKFLGGAFAMSEWTALALFALLIVAYSAIGGFRGSVYTDTLQAIIRILGTVIALAAVVWFAIAAPAAFYRNLGSAGASFLEVLPGGLAITVGFVLGFAAAAVGFGLGQPQIVSRYLAGSSPEETRAAWWIYISFVQFTWIAMTIFGVLLRGVMPGIADPETGLSLFFQHNIGTVLTGVIVADIFATIASTTNGLLIAMAQAVQHDLLPRMFRNKQLRVPIPVLTLLIGVVTMLVSVTVHGTVFTLAIASVSMMGAGLAAAVMIKVLGWKHSGMSMLASISVGILAAILWKHFGLGSTFNESGVGMAAGLIANWAILKVTRNEQSSTASAPSDVVN